MPKASTTSRGYGWKHQQLRKSLARQVPAGLASCARCGRPILPDQPWDLGHDDYDRTIYAGPERLLWTTLYASYHRREYHRGFLSSAPPHPGER